MNVAHRHPFERPAWTSASNLFSLLFALLVALALIVLLMLFFQVMQREIPRQAPNPARTAGIWIAPPGYAPARVDELG